MLLFKNKNKDLSNMMKKLTNWYNKFNNYKKVKINNRRILKIFRFNFNRVNKNKKRIVFIIEKYLII